MKENQYPDEAFTWQTIPGSDEKLPLILSRHTPNHSDYQVFCNGNKIDWPHYADVKVGVVIVANSPYDDFQLISGKIEIRKRVEYVSPPLSKGPTGTTGPVCCVGIGPAAEKRRRK